LKKAQEHPYTRESRQRTPRRHLLLPHPQPKPKPSQSRKIKHHYFPVAPRTLRTFADFLFTPLCLHPPQPARTRRTSFLATPPQRRHFPPARKYALTTCGATQIRGIRVALDRRASLINARWHEIRRGESFLMQSDELMRWAVMVGGVGWGRVTSMLREKGQRVSVRGNREYLIALFNKHPRLICLSACFHGT
jgi:hypothetical protein